jgi:hypothetical protein
MTYKNYVTKFSVALLSSIIGLSTAGAFNTVHETGDLLKEKEKQFTPELQFITSGNTGINLIGRFDMGYSSDSNLRFLIGTGTTDLEAGAFYKWVPYPDFEKQPAIGFTVGAQYARYEKSSKLDSKNEISFRIIPFTSKKFETEKGIFTPYASLPIGFTNYDSKSYTPVQLVLGSRYKHPDFDTCEFSAELGFNINDSDAHISFAAIFPAFE